MRNLPTSGREARRATVPIGNLHHEIRAKRGRKFGSQIRSRNRQEAVSRFNAPHPPAATLPLLVAAHPRERGVSPLFSASLIGQGSRGSLSKV